jgi:uncharacterized protein YjbJ (UPF0337 family)
VLQRTSDAPRFAASVAPSAPGRFSPLTAPQRAQLEAFLVEARPWAVRQARRTYAHLPAELHDQAVRQAELHLRTGRVSRFDRRGLYAELSQALTDSLKRVHSGWCLNQARAVWGSDSIGHSDDTSRPTSAHPVAAFIEDGLGGLERAVLQLEIGASRDTATARAALRLGPRQYQRHRDQGLSKLRSAVGAHVRGRVCQEHLDAVTLAATGDRIAAAKLSAGPSRCRVCAREASALRRVLHERLAIAPWPLAIKPAGIIVAKLGAVGAIVSGKSGAVSTSGSALTGGAGMTVGAAKTVATVLAAAALTTGGVAALNDGPIAQAPARSAAERLSVSAPATTPGTSTTTVQASPARPEHRRDVASRAPSTQRDGGAAKQSAGTTTQPASHQPSTPAPSTGSVQQVAGTVRDTVTTTTGTVKDTVGGVKKTVDEVKRTVAPVTEKVPPVVPAVPALPQTAAPDVKGTVDQAAGTVKDTVGGLLKP